ncbi:ribose/xylose/arabinose/galactoside ABC-type transport system permease subunit [Rhizobium leguminosarum]
MMAATSTILTPKGANGSVLLTLMKLRTFIALFAVIIFFAIFAPNFTSTANMILMSKHVALNAFLAMGMTFVIITGGIDLSVGSIVGLCGMVAGGLILYGIELPIGYTIFFNLFEIVLITLSIGLLIGLINGLLITKLNVAPFIATLGTLYIARGLALLSSDGQTFPNLVGRPEYANDRLRFLRRGTHSRPAGVDLDSDRACAAGRLCRPLDTDRSSHLRRRRQ